MITRMDPENAGEKCPKCLFIGRTFCAVDNDTWACMDCGCHFMPKARRQEVKLGIRAAKEEEASQPSAARQALPYLQANMPPEAVAPVKKLPCGHPGCDFSTDYPLALSGHKRKHRAK